MDIILIGLVIAIIVVALFFKNFKSVVIFIGLTEVFLRLIHRISQLINLKVLNDFVNKYIPTSLEEIINNYSTGILNTILIWILILLFVFFEWYLIKYWLVKKK